MRPLNHIWQKYNAKTLLLSISLNLFIFQELLDLLGNIIPIMTSSQLYKIPICFSNLSRKEDPREPYYVGLWTGLCSLNFYFPRTIYMPLDLLLNSLTILAIRWRNDGVNVNVCFPPRGMSKFSLVVLALAYLQSHGRNLMTNSKIQRQKHHKHKNNRKNSPPNILQI